MSYLEPLWTVLEDYEEIDLTEAIEEAGLDPYKGRMAVREVLLDFTLRWKKTLRAVIKRKDKIRALAKSDLFEKIMLLERCEHSELTPEGLDLSLWWEKLRFNKTVRTESALFEVNSPIRMALTYDDLMEAKNGKLP